MRISLIGMSGSGKSHWSSRLSRSGFRRFCCDDLITEKLSSELNRGGKSLTLGQWMGFPFDAGYEEREEMYLACEKEVLAQVLDWMEGKERAGDTGDIVVDTTGSVIYTGIELLKRLSALTTVIHFASPPRARQEMLNAYMADPRPILWRGLFRMEDGESRQDALRRCYELLLESRETLYRRLADTEVSYEARRNPDFNILDFLSSAGSQP